MQIVEVTCVYGGVGGLLYFIESDMKSIYDIVGLYVRILKQFIIN